MEWSRVKTILIVLLLIVNVFLFIAYAGSSLRESSDEDQIKEDVVSVLNKLGVEIDIRIIPNDSDIRFPARAERDLEAEAQAVGALLGRVSVDSSEGGKVEYNGERGSGSVRTGGYIEFELFHTDAIRDEAQAQRIAQGMARALNTEFYGQSVQVEREDGKYRVTGTLSLSGIPVYDCWMALEMQEDRGVKISGKMIPGKLTYLTDVKPRTISGLLLNLVEYMEQLGTPCEKIEEIASGYKTEAMAGGDGGAMNLIPVWRIRADGQDWFLNALTGKVITID